MLIAIAAFSSCKCSGNQQNKDNISAIDSVTLDERLLDNFNKSKLIFYTMPSPLETAMLIKRSGAIYDEDLLNPVSSVNNYQTNLKMALNLGIYSADMSYASLFDQTQTTIKYIGVAKKLADGLGILQAIDEEAIKKLEANMNNRDVVLDIISEAFMNSNAFLTENNRESIAVTVLIGGWIEGLYFATGLTNGSLENNKNLVDRIIYQKLSLETVLNLLEDQEQNENIKYLTDKMNELKVIFDQVKIVSTSNVEAVTNPEERTTIIRADSETFMSKEVFGKLIEKVREIRSEFIS
jgi:Asp-tRNA(Asn)/Glu-tRNA(Gln) amidotransferase C subunit